MPLQQRSAVSPFRDSLGSGISAAFGLGFGLLPSTGDTFGVAVIVFGLIALAFGARPNLRSWAWLFASQYIAVQFALNWYHEAIPFGNAFQHSYLVILAGVFLALSLLSLPQIDPARITAFLPYGIMGAVALLGLDYFTDWYGSACRVNAFSGNPQWPAAALMAVVTPLLAWEVGRGHLSKNAYVLVALLFIALGAFTGARMAFYGFSLEVAVFIALLLWRKQRGAAGKLVLAAVLGASSSFIIDIQSRCDFSVRVGQQVTLLPKVLETLHLTAPASLDGQAAPAILDTSDPIYAAGGSRAQFWNNAIEAFPKSPWIGFGQKADGPIASMGLPQGQGAPHLHNQFLSWAIWGGVVGLASGLALLLGPIFTARQKLPAVFYALSWGLVGASESIFSFPMGLSWCLLGLVVFERLFQMPPDQPKG